jgi:hypothetical protein
VVNDAKSDGHVCNAATHSDEVSQLTYKAEKSRMSMARDNRSRWFVRLCRLFSADLNPKVFTAELSLKNI